MIKVLQGVFDSDRPKLPLIGSFAPVIFIVAYFLIGSFFITPWGNFPLNDDWIYGESVRKLLESGSFHMGASCAACFLHIALGAVACKFFGYSYAVLRCLSLIFWLAGSLALYLTVREIGLNQKTAAIFALVYMVNPILMNVSFSYMTDISAISLTIFYLLFTVKAVKRDSPWFFFFASCALLATIAVRPIAVVVVPANAFLLLVYWLRKRHSWTITIGLIVLPIFLTLILQHYMKVTSEFPEGYKWYTGEIASLLKGYLRHTGKSVYVSTILFGQVACYLGLFLAPILVSFIGAFRDLFKAKVRIASIWFVQSTAIVTLTLSNLVATKGRLMPSNQNLLRMPSVGATNIMGVNIPALSSSWRGLLTGISATFAFVLLVILGSGANRAILLAARALKRGLNAPDQAIKRTTLAGFCFLSLSLNFAFLLLQLRVIDLDRYYLLVVVPVLLCLALSWRWLRVRGNFPLSILILLVMSTYSLLATNDFVSWNRMRWQAITSLEATGQKSNIIDGGAEYNFLRDPNLANSVAFGPGFHGVPNRGKPPRDAWRWWPIAEDDLYIISFSPIPDYNIVKNFPYWSALTFSQHDVLILKKNIPVKETQKTASLHVTHL
jgi:hypothetical protein